MTSAEGSTSDNSCFAFTIRRQTYLDSVALMRISRSVCELDGVADAALMMATPANTAIMLNANLIGSEHRQTLDDAGPSDLLIAVRASSEPLCNSALHHAEELLDRPLTDVSSASGEEQESRPATLRLAHEQMPGANLALISVPGEFAAAEARKALIRGLNVMLFSDNVSLEDEFELKQFAVTRGLIVMGPDCGTAHIAGVPLAFANQVKSGSIGLVGASGTGLQEVMCLLDAQSLGVSHAIGVGGRDLSDKIGGLSTLQALDWLDNDAATQRIVVISKPPAARALDALIERINTIDKPVVACLIGMPVNERQAIADKLAANVQLVSSLEAAAGVPAAGVPASAAEASDPQTSDTHKKDPSTDHHNNIASLPRPGKIRGLFCGGTLCAEAQVVLQEGGCEVMSNAPIPGASAIKPDVENPLQAGDAQHVLLDLGADEFTAGKPHPMIEPQLRSDWIEQAMTMSDTSVLLLDCVLGFGSHQDPAGIIVDALKRVQPDSNQYPLAIVASVTGTEQDFQIRSRQIDKLQAAGVIVCRSNAEATRQALAAQVTA